MLPFRRKVVRSTKRGAFPTGEGRLCCFPLAPWGGFEGFIIRGAFLMSRLPPSCRLVFTAFPLTYCLFCAHSAENARVDQSWSGVGEQRSIIIILPLVHPFATSWHFPSRGNEKFRIAFLLVGRPAILRCARIICRDRGNRFIAINARSTI